jgi:hemerythrin superfamily protein
VTNLFTSDTSKGTNAVDLLKADHDVVEDLFSKVKANEDGNNAPVFTKIKSELDVHAHIEETIFYPFLLERGDKELKKIVREGIEEHRQVKLFLAELASLPGDNAKFKAKLQVLMEDVEHHVKEEEGDMFPMVEDQFDEPVLETLGAIMQAEKGRFKTGNASTASAR